MKKLLLSLGALTAVVAPVATVVACGTNDTDGNKDDAQLIALDEATQKYITVGIHVQVKPTDLTTKVEDLTFADSTDPHGSNAVLTPEFASKLFNAGIAVQSDVEDTLIETKQQSHLDEGIKYELSSAIDMIISKDELTKLGWDESTKKFLTRAEMNTAKAGSGDVALKEIDDILNAHLKSVGLEGTIVLANTGKNRIILDGYKDAIAAEHKIENVDKFVTKSTFYNTDDVKVVEFVM